MSVNIPKESLLKVNLTEVNLLEMLEDKYNSTLNMKELPPAKNGIIKFDGYMDQFFNNQPPTPAVNWVFNNKTLNLFKDLTSSY